MRYLLLALTLLIAGRAAATGEINVLTDLKSPFPPGCVAVSLPEAPASTANTLWNENIAVPSIGSNSKDARVQVTIWRTGCHDSGFSVVMVRLQKTSGDFAVLVPKVYAEAGDVALPMHVAQLLHHPAVGNVGASANVISEAPVTYMLGVDPFSIDGETEFLPEDYNDRFTLEFFWGDFSTFAQDGELFDIPPYDPEDDPPQNEYQVLHGRMSGQYTVEGLPYSGLFMQIGEEFDDTNTITATFFTYMDGQPFWVIGAKNALEPGFDIVTLDMLEVYGGEFIAMPPGSYTDDDVEWSSMGTMTIEALDCNRLLIGYNFTDSGYGSGSFEADRLVRTAGYDCNPWE
jgi:hypothetical protein